MHSVIRFIHKTVKSEYYLHHVCPLGMAQLALSDFSWFFFFKPAEKIQLSLKSDKNKGYFTWRPIYIFDHISLSSS